MFKLLKYSKLLFMQWICLIAKDPLEWERQMLFICSWNQNREKHKRRKNYDNTATTTGEKMWWNMKSQGMIEHKTFELTKSKQLSVLTFWEFGGVAASDFKQNECSACKWHILQTLFSAYKNNTNITSMRSKRR